MRYLLYILFCMLPVLAHTQTNWEWATGGTDTYDASGNSITTDLAGNIYVTGTFEDVLSIGTFSVTSAGGADMFIAKMDAAGNILWLKSGGGGGTDVGTGLAVDSSGNIYMIGTISLSATFGSTNVISNGANDVCLIKYSSDGDLVWVRSWGGSYPDRAGSIKIDQGNNVYITGDFDTAIMFDAISLTSYGYGDMFITKLDTAGNVKWATNGGGSSYEFSWDIDIDRSFNVYVAASSGSVACFFNTASLGGSCDMFIAKYDSAGNFSWAKGMTGAGGFAIDGNSVKVDKDGYVYASGYSFEDQNIDFGGSVVLTNPHAFIARYAPNGNLMWAKPISTANTIDASNKIVLDDHKNIYVAGYYDFWGIFGSDTVYTNGSWDASITKLDSNGNYLWAAVGGGGSFDEAHALVLTDDGRVITTGSLASNNPYFGSNTLSTGQPLFIAALSQTTGIPVTAGKDKQLYIYPNPANDMLYIQGIKESMNYKIVSITGTTLQEGIVAKNRGSINIEILSPGIFLLYVAGEVHKIVKE